MKSTILLLLLLSTTRVSGQNYILPTGEYMDTTAVSDTSCQDYDVYFYQVGGKYPRSSYTILSEALHFLQVKNQHYDGTGNITFQFKIDCAGNRMKKTKVLQTDEKYKNYHFDKGLVNELYLFLNTLNQWVVAKTKDGHVYPYKAFITFKIKDGKVVNIIP